MQSQTILAISLFFHLSATVIWIGGLVITSVLVWPEARRTLSDSPALAAFLHRLRRRFTPLANMSLAVLIVTGLTQMSMDVNYDGVMQFTNPWSRAILLKHVALAGMVVAGLLLQYGVAPAMERAAVLMERAKGEAGLAAQADWARLRQREIRLTWLNLALAVVVLACSAWAGSI